MAVHIFTVSEENYKICVEKGLVALPEAKEGQRHDNVFDGLLSRLSGVKEDDYVLMYVIKSKSLRGVWQVEGRPFYEETRVWEDRLYPFRCRIKWSKYNFQNALRLDDINDLRNTGKIWTWALERSTGSNSMFSISNGEFLTLLTEFMKINPFSTQKGIIMQPYQYREFNIIDNLHFQDDEPKYEFTIMALLSAEFARGSYLDIFGNYSDYLSYVPTNLGKEIDFLLMYDSPISEGQVVSYDIIEVKRDVFNEDALSQLISYESWFLQKKVSGDSNMVRTTAIAKSYAPDVIQYVSQRSHIENKPIKLLQYSYNNGKLDLIDISV
ncbi:MAG: hypothetical protein IJ079_09455 [Lachnospiraceae bacterium]|nr:hypothetical protein [Lachnospiraceae bacterium]